jgi:hypothetical protein
MQRVVAAARPKYWIPGTAEVALASALNGLKTSTVPYYSMDRTILGPSLGLVDSDKGQGSSPILSQNAPAATRVKTSLTGVLCHEAGP